MKTIPVSFNFTKYNNFKSYRERWLEVIESKMTCKDVFFELDVVSNDEIIRKYNPVQFQELKKLISSITE